MEDAEAQDQEEPSTSHFSFCISGRVQGLSRLSRILMINRAANSASHRSANQASPLLILFFVPPWPILHKRVFSITPWYSQASTWGPLHIHRPCIFRGLRPNHTSFTVVHFTGLQYSVLAYHINFTLKIKENFKFNPPILKNQLENFLAVLKIRFFLY